MIEEKWRICFDVPICIGIIWGRGKCPSKNVSTKEQLFLLATEMKRGK
jgi:hypothetical protein